MSDDTESPPDNVEKLQEIFTLACDAMKEKLKKPEEVTAADLNAVLGFFKHNNITAIATKKGGPLKEVVEAVNEGDFPFAVPGSLLAPDDPAVLKTKAGQA